jgi:hypothetical protein
LLEKIRSDLQPWAAATQDRKNNIMKIKRREWKSVEYARRKGKGSSKGHALNWNPLRSARPRILLGEKSMRNL